MLKHDEPQDLPAASQRVTAEELSRAVSAVDEARAAEQIHGTAPIGQVVEELNLDATPEEIWAQVQRQRAEDAAKTPAQTGRVSPAARQVRERRKGNGWVLVVLGCMGFVGLVSQLTHRGGPPAGVVISGDAQTLTSATAGKPVEVRGSSDTLTLTGDCPVLTVSGDANIVRVQGRVETLVIGGSGNTVRVQGRVGKVAADGDSNTVAYTAAPAPVLSGVGSGNRVGPEH